MNLNQKAGNQIFTYGKSGMVLRHPHRHEHR